MQFRSVLVAALASTVAAKGEKGSSTETSTAAMSMSTGTTSGSGTKTFAVRVGMDATGKTVLKYSPDSITAPVGSVVQFQFMAGNHTVTQSTFDGPCVPTSDDSTTVGFHSGFVPAAAALAKGEIPVYSITINDTKPIWVYCAQAKHCESGMSMVINENTKANSSRSLANYQAAAKNVAESKVPAGDEAVGGTSGLASASASSGSGSASKTGSGSSTGTGVATAGAAPMAAAQFAAPGLLALLAAML